MRLEDEARASTGSETEATAVLTHTLGSTGGRQSDVADSLYGARLGRFILAEFLGEGASGRVYVAHDTILDRAVAIKLLRASASDAHIVQERLLGEARALARLSHTNVVQIYDVGVFQSKIYLALEHVDGVTLRVWQQRHAGDWRAIVAMYCQCGEGLAAAHRVGLVHRDFKPENVMVSKDGRAHVLDFGLASVMESTEVIEGEPDGRFEGTPGYMAPEQYLQQPTDARSDQFSFCVALYEALYQVRPFAATTIPDQRERVLAGELPSAPVLTSVPPRLLNLLRRGLAVDPGQRWPGMQALLVELKAHLRPSRSLGLFALAVTAAVILSLAAGLGLWRRHQRSEQVAACVAAGREIEAVWNDDAREALRRSLLATGVHYAQTAYDKALPWLDRRAAEWSERRTQACREATINGTLTPDLYARSTACFDERRDELEALLTVLGEVHKTAVQRAVVAVAGLAQLSSCEDLGALERRPPPSSDPDRQARANGLRRALMRVTSLSLAGRASEGRDQALALLAEAEALGDAALIVQVRASAGSLLMRTGQLEPAEQALALAYLDGGAIGADETAATAAVLLIELVGTRGARYAEGLQWARSAEMLVRRLGQMDTTRGAGLLNNLSTLHAVRGAYVEALATGERALAIRTRELGPSHPGVAASLTNLAETHRASGDLVDAVRLGEQALALGEQTLGPEHPNVAMTLNNLGGAWIPLGDLERAEALLTRALTIRERALGPEHADVADTLNNLGEIYRRRGELDPALVTFQRGLTITEHTLGPEHPNHAANLLSLAVLALDRKEFGEALPLGERALNLREKAFGGEHPEVARALAEVARIHVARGEASVARAQLERAVAIWERSASVGVELADLLTELGELSLASERPDEALPLFERAMAIHGAHDGVQPGETVAQFGAARALVATGGDRARAIALARAARDSPRKAHAAGTVDLAEVERWLATHESGE